MGVAENGNGGLVGECCLADLLISFLQVIAVAMRHKDPAAFKLKDPLIGRVSEKIVVSRDAVERSVRELAVDDLTPFKVAGVQQDVIVFLFFQNAQEKIVLRMRVSQDQDFHQLLPFADSV